MKNRNPCANGMMGYDIQNGKSYVPKPTCQRERVTGHIFCDPCRMEAGGYSCRPIVKTTSALAP